ncbi:MAG: DUF2334 domain-containing protein [Thermoplasmatales archaeon]|nr:DUF2334 domain-containing protein [Thermoplasmatales archaeon]
MYCKKVIIKDDDVDARDQRDPSICLKWLTNLTLEKDIKVTYGVIVGNETFCDNMELVDYLNSLDKTHFEIATHGYTHEHFKGMPYDEQYSRIENATKTIENYLHVRSYTFITPGSNDDANTSKVCEALGYHSFSSGRAYPNDNIVDFKIDACLEYNWSQSPPEHCSFNSLKNNFDDFYNSTDEYYVICMHHNTFWYENKTTLNQTRVNNFEDFIDYVKTKNVEFMTIEDAYEWEVDKDRIIHNQTKNSYIIDFGRCEYNHTVKFTSPENYQGKKIVVLDATTNNVIGKYDANYFEFTGVKGHRYEINVEKESEINDNLQYWVIVAGVVVMLGIVGIYYKRQKKIDR